MSLEKFVEFTGPNFNYHGYSNARYRAYFPKITVTGDNFGNATLELPSKLEALNEKGEWVKHPVVFKHYSDFKGNNGYLIIFHTNGYQSHNLRHKWKPALDKFYEDAKNKDLTEGSKSNIASFFK